MSIAKILLKYIKFNATVSQGKCVQLIISELV
jgi:hypothetical protein